MTYNGVVQALESIIRRYKDAAHHVSCIVNINILKEALDTIKEQKAEIERLNKSVKAAASCFTRMESLYKIKCKELEVAKSEAIKEFEEELEYFILNEDVEIVKPKCKYYGSYINGANQFRHQIKNGIKKLVKEMEVSE